MSKANSLQQKDPTNRGQNTNMLPRFYGVLKRRHVASRGVTVDSLVAPSRKVGRNGLWAGHYCSVVAPAGTRASVEQRPHKNEKHDELQKA